MTNLEYKVLRFLGSVIKNTKKAINNVKNDLKNSNSFNNDNYKINWNNNFDKFRASFPERNIPHSEFINNRSWIDRLQRDSISNWNTTNNLQFRNWNDLSNKNYNSQLNLNNDFMNNKSDNKYKYWKSIWFIFTTLLSIIIIKKIIKRK